MKVSVIVPVYNVAEYVEECIRSVLCQTYRNLELVIVDDCTKDNSMDIIRNVLDSVHTTDISVKIVRHEKNKGLSVARNTGIAHSSGDYLFFLDSDDKITDDCIEVLSEALGNGTMDVVVGDYVVENPDKYYPLLKLKTSVLRGQAYIRKIYMKERMYPMAWNRLVARRFITENGLYFKEGMIHEDVLWTFQCMCVARMMAVVKHVTYVYRLRENSITIGIAFEDNLSVNMDVLREIVSYAQEKRLMNDRYVYAYIEKRKLELLYYCREAKKQEEDYAVCLYDFISSLPRAGLLRILCWDFFSMKKMIRDAHYFMPSNSCKEEYYWNIPVYVKGHLGVFKQIRFYSWFIFILLKRIWKMR